MRKNTIINLAGLLLALCIALGGLLGVWTRLAREEALLLQGGGTVELLVQSEPAQSEDVPTARPLRIPLAEEELTLVIQSLESGAEPYPHEPGQNQLSMTDAIECGRSWMESFFMPHLGIEDFCLDGYKTSCYLWTTQEDTPLLSYWTVTFNAKNVDAELILNATSGQILDASVFCSFPTEHQDLESLHEFLSAYAESFQLEGKYVLVRSGSENAGINGQTLYQSVGSQGIFAAINMSSIVVSTFEPNAGVHDDFTMNAELLSVRLRLTSRVPE